MNFKNFLPSNVLFKNISVVGLWTSLSRILGFIRDILMAAFLGSGPMAEAFLIAFSIPNMFRRLFAEGAFSTAFIPMFSKKIANKADAENFASESLSLLLTSLIGLIAIAELLMPALVFIMASGFFQDGRFELTVDYARIMFPYIVFISLAAFFSGVLNSFNKYSVAAAVPLLLNFFLLSALVLAHVLEKDYGVFLIVAVPSAGLIQLFVIWYEARKLNLSIKLKLPVFNKDIKKLLKIALPAALAGGVIQINLLIGRQVASFFEGAVAWLSYADRLYQLPLGVVGIAIGVVLLPDLSKKVLNSDKDGINESTNRSAELALLLIFPATIALIIIPEIIISILFERGEFTQEDTIFSGSALRIYAFGLPAFVFQKILSTIYFSHGNTKSPFNYAIISMFANLILAVGLIPMMGYLAPAVGTTIAGWVITWLLWKNAKQFNLRISKQLKANFLRISLSSALMCITLLLLESIFSKELQEPDIRYFAFALLILISTSLYFLTLKLLGFFK